MNSFLLVFVGGGVGATLRHAINRVANAYAGPGLPYGTLFVNVVGCLLMGVFAQLFLDKAGISAEVRLFLTTGPLGGFTTFSAFGLEAALMWQRGAWGTFGIYVVGSVLLSIGALLAGMAIVRVLAE